MTIDSENSSSEFYYLGKQSDAEQLKFPTYSESGDKRQHSSQMGKFKK